MGESLSNDISSNDESPGSRMRLRVCVFTAAFSMIYLEVLLFHSLLFVAPYIEATMAIPIALLGISIGGLVTYFGQQRFQWIRSVSGGHLLALALGFPLAYSSIVLFSSISFRVPVLMVVPFVLGSIILSIAFVRARSSRVYFFDLLGAGVGAAVAAGVLNFIDTESAYFVGALLNVAIGTAVLISSRRLCARHFIIVPLLLVISITALVYHGATDGLNFARLAIDYEGLGGASRPHRFLNRHGTAKDGEISELVYTHSSISGRTDCIVTRRLKDDRILMARVYHDGLPSDGFKFAPTEKYCLDPRVPWGFIEDPDTLIIGTSAPGVVGPVGGMGNGEVVGVEICKGKVELMKTDQAREWSFNAYHHIDQLEVLDGRTYLSLNPEKKFDHITMMNAHLGMRWGRASAPEFLHTVEGIATMIEHLTDRGFVNIEEVAKYNDVNVHTNIKLASTIVGALEHLGVDKPSDHVYVFRWGDFIQFFIKRTPFDDRELAWLDNWLDRQVKNRRGQPFIVTPSIASHPRKPIRGANADLVRGEWTGDSQLMNYAPATDDRPYAFDVVKRRPIETGTVLIVLLIALVTVLLPAGYGLFWRERVRPKVGFAMLLYFGLLGVAYLLVEIVLIQRYQLYIGSSAGSLVAVLGGMLVFSGLGALASERFGDSRLGSILPFVAVVALAVAMGLGLPWFFELAVVSSLTGRMIIAAASLAPLAFFMGMPFPIALRTSKVVSRRSVAALLFAVNGGFSAVATPIALLLSMNYGYQMTFIIGASLYLLLLLFLQPFFRSRAVKEGI
jgi:hypothetical protein